MFMSGIEWQNRYPMKDGKISIELKLKTPNQLFDERDPSPFRERDLDDDAVQYIVNSMREIPDMSKARLGLYFATLDEGNLAPQLIRNALHAHFRYEAELKRRELRYTFKQGFKSLAIGLTFLMACTAFSHGMYAEGGPFVLSLIKEGLFVMGWVAMWKPISTFLYEWWPIRASQKLLNILAEIEVDIRPMANAPSEAGGVTVTNEAVAPAALRVSNLKLT